MKDFSISPLELVRSVWMNKALIKTLAEREILGRYRGSFLGILWSFLNPVFMLTIYTFVFSLVFKARWGIEGESTAEFALILFAGLIVFNFFSENISRAPTLILSNVNYVKKVVFPLEILPIVTLGSAFFHLIISLLVWFIFYLILSDTPTVYIFYLPLVLLPLIFISLGISFFLVSLGVYMRDISQIIGMVITGLMFLSPIFYPISALPDQYQFLLLFNPLTTEIEMVRDVLIWGKSPNWNSYLFYLTASLLMLCLGFSWFQKTRKGFADVL
jgi:lipopolysaccharide transport system permease protein